MKKFLLMSMGFLFFLASPSYATIIDMTWNDLYIPDPVPLYMQAGGENSSHHYVHDLTNDGFNPDTDDVDNYTLTLFVSDDFAQRENWVEDIWKDTEKEYLTVVTSLFWYEGTFEVTHPFITLDDNFLGEWSLDNFGGMLTSLYAKHGDLYFWGSLLKAEGTSSVPEPGTILLLGCGLLGLVSISRKKIIKK